MTILEVRKKLERCSSSKSTTRTVSDVYWVRTSTKPTSTIPLETASDGTRSIPGWGSAHPDDSSRYVTSIVPRCLDQQDMRLWEVTVEYSDQLIIFDDPLSQPAEVSWSGETCTEPIFMDQSDTPVPITNSAGDEFDPLIQREVSYPICTITRNEASFSPSTIVTYADAVNTNSFTIHDANGTAVTVAARQARMGTISATEQIQNGVRFYKVAYPMKFRPDWRLTVDDRGAWELVDLGTDGVISVPILDDAGGQVSSWPLDGIGSAMANWDDEPAHLTFKIYKERTFSFGF